MALQIWDIGGQTIGSKMIGNYIYGAQAVLLVYDITNFQSFQNLEDWLELVRKTFVNETPPYTALIGNKTDLQHLRTVKNEKHVHFADEQNMESFFMSAKTGDYVNATFYRIAADLAGVVLTRSELEGSARVVQAEIVNHPQHDPDQQKLVLKVATPSLDCDFPSFQTLCKPTAFSCPCTLHFMSMVVIAGAKFSHQTQY